MLDPNLCVRLRYGSSSLVLSFLCGDCRDLLFASVQDRGQKLSSLLPDGVMQEMLQHEPNEGQVCFGNELRANTRGM